MKKAAISLLAIVSLIFAVSLFYSSGKQRQSPLPSGENVICFGDSLTAGTGASFGMDYPSQLSGLLGEPVINAGFPGNTARDALARLDKDVLSKSPRIVLITLGGNDLKNRVPRSQAFADLKEIVERIQAKGAMVVVGGIDIPLFGRGFGYEYKKLCEQTGALLIPNVYDGILGQENLMSDPIHPNDKGYQIIAERFYGVIKGYKE